MKGGGEAPHPSAVREKESRLPRKSYRKNRRIMNRSNRTLKKSALPYANTSATFALGEEAQEKTHTKHKVKKERIAPKA